jgi:hypothetical protein
MRGNIYKSIILANVILRAFTLKVRPTFDVDIHEGGRTLTSMKFFGLSNGLLVLFSLHLVSATTARADNDPKAVALLQKVKDAYKSASYFSCEGHYEQNLETTLPVKLMGNFKMLFARPDEIRVDWTDTKMGGETVTNSVFTQDKTIFFYWGLLNKWAAQKDMETALGTAAGISHGISYAIPSLLRDKAGYLAFTSLKPPENAVVDGVNCVILAGTTRFQGEMELAIDPNSFAIRQIKITHLIRHKDIQDQIDKARKEAAKSHPELVSKLKDTPATPDFTAVEVTTYHDPVFGKELSAADFVYPVPATTPKVDNILK